MYLREGGGVRRGEEGKRRKEKEREGKEGEGVQRACSGNTHFFIIISDHLSGPFNFGIPPPFPRHLTIRSRVRLQRGGGEVSVSFVRG